MTQTAIDFDVLIVGAGISGIGMAAHLEMLSPDRSYAVLEMREQLGGTWDLFRYPGVRSDSDMQTLSYHFEPWTHEDSIADASSILEYLHRVVDNRGIREKIRFNTRVIAADWRAEDAAWHLTVEDAQGGRSTLTARFLYLGSGYYDYEQPHDARIPGSDSFAGTIAHPQFWPSDLDHAGKRVVVIGSGATAITLVPAMAETAGHVTMLQRTPTWVMSLPGKDRMANLLHRILPAKLAHKILRKRNVFFTDWFFKRSRAKPKKVVAMLQKDIKSHLGDKYNAADFTPPYNPWDERMCFVRDGDLFDAIVEDRAAIATGHITAIEKDGVRLKDGRFLPADIIVTATGLQLAVAGKIAISLDGKAVVFSDHFFYKNCMFDGIPNFALLVVYLNASATLRVDMVTQYLCRVLNHMRDAGAHSATPVIPQDAVIEDHEMFDFTSGYIQRAKHLMPKSSLADPWRLSHDYLRDRVYMRKDPVDDGNLVFAKTGNDQVFEAAE
ncbi:flavin-containing monooxygenase [Qipengyuania marisflavi]|uniref:NAD(P)/FAD-dependent oxidoreductase n=1 Tax=Qipengyuania marisflavi TaxID=2486356 RepID=A0A5S3P3C5_9SPHN|nr:NAD(P)/FAD-dependent oxidoreductase [Qipengyuania marisflavi]TMM47338.1 NAD(P)/FAD-dependent oxidoreductase [Qipengyuania marisflavi]